MEFEEGCPSGPRGAAGNRMPRKGRTGSNPVPSAITKTSYLDYLKSQLSECLRVIKESEDQLPLIEKAGVLIAKRIKEGGKLLIFGNGGSAADSIHFSGELVGKFRKLRKGVPAIALPADIASLTAISNDWEYGYSFERQVEALGKEGDIAFGISTSGNSENVVRALKKAKQIGLFTIGLTGASPCLMEEWCDLLIRANSTDTQRIQEFHKLAIHLICDIVEKELFPD